MGDGLLVRLRSYRARSDRDSLEDFITEAFCWLLQLTPELSYALLQRINEALVESKHFTLPEDPVEWQTQVTLGASRLDMMASWPSMRLIFEHKVWAALGDDQLPRYGAAVEKRFPSDERRLILITANRMQHEEADACLCWSDIFKLVSALAETLDTDLGQAYSQEFLELLRHEGLAPAAPIAHQALRYYPIVRDLPTQLEKVLAPLQGRRDWPVPEAYLCRFRQHWGRIGLEFYLKDKLQVHEWSPGLFLGCVLDGADHRIQHRHQDALQMQLILDFSQHLHQQFPAMKSYQGLKEALAKATPATTNGWQFYDHLSDSKAFNKYHPLYLERPLLEVFRSLNASEEQQNRFYELGSEALVLMRDAGLADLMDECGRVSAYNGRN